MADNIIKRIIQLVLDRTSAKKTQDEMDGLAKHVEDTWKETAKKIAEFIGIAFLTEKVVEFGKASVEAASESEAVWSDLKTTIDNTGDSFDNMEQSLRATAEAFQDATGKHKDEFAASLSRLITLTGDTSASLNNMGLVANVAAKFFRGDLQAATTAVAKAMNGNVTALQRMGIAAKDGQQALEILAERSMGAAVRRSETFAGGLDALHSAWQTVLEDLGTAIITSEGAGTAMDVLREAVKTLGEWIVANKGEISQWVTNGIAFAIDATDVLIRSVGLLWTTIAGLAETSVGVAAHALGKLAQAYATVLEAKIGFDLATGIKVNPDDIIRTDQIRKEADALVNWGKAMELAGDKSAEAAKKFLMNPLFSSDAFKAGAKAPTKLEGEDNAPSLSKNARTESTKEVEKAIEEFGKAEKAAAQMKEVLGVQFDGVSAEIDRTTKLFNVLTGNGIDPTTTKFGDLAARLRTLVTETKPFEEVAKQLAKTLGTDVAVAAVTSATGFETATTKLELLKQQQGATLAAMKALADQQLQNSDAFKMYALQYQALTAQVTDETKVQAIIDSNKALAKSLNEDTATAILTNVSALDQLKQQQANVVEQYKLLIKDGIDPASDAAMNLETQYNSLKDAIADAQSIELLNGIFKDLAETMQRDLFMATLDQATVLDKLKIEHQNLAAQISKIAIPKTKEEAKALEELTKRYKANTDAIAAQTLAMDLQAQTADVLAEALGTALAGGLGKAAAQKAKQNAIEAAEMLVRAGVFAIFGNPVGAAASLKAAAGFALVAAEWGALAAASGGFSGGGGTSTVSAAPPAATSGGDNTPTAARESQSAAAARNTPPSSEVSIYLVGPGFNALNPEVQKVVRGAQQEIRERYGTDTRIKIRNPGE